MWPDTDGTHTRAKTNTADGTEAAPSASDWPPQCAMQLLERLPPATHTGN